MSVALDLTKGEQGQLEQLLQQVRRESGRPSTLNAMFAQWGALVSAVERGYDDCIYDYTNDISVRDQLEQLVREAPPTLQTKLERALEPVDGRFMNATEEAARPLTEFAGEIPRWWWCRVPRRRSGELAEDLEALGYVD